MKPAPNGRSRSGGTSGVQQGENGAHGGAQPGWRVAAALPPLRRQPREASAEIRAVVDAALRDGQPRERDCATRPAALSLAKRVRYAAGQAGALVSARITPNGERWTLTVTITKREAEE